MLNSIMCLRFLGCCCQRPNGSLLDLRPEGLLRKEVVQPLVPQRLPCYDFIPVTGPTLDVCLPCGLARRLGVKPAPMM